MSALDCTFNIPNAYILTSFQRSASIS